MTTPKWVRCIRITGTSGGLNGEDHLTKDAIYKVEKEEDDHYNKWTWVIGKDGQSHQWASERFVPATDPTTTVAPTSGDAEEERLRDLLTAPPPGFCKCGCPKEVCLYHKDA